MILEDLLIELLSTFGYPVRLQGSFTEDEKYPEHFFTFWNNSSNDSSYFDNVEHSTIYSYSVNFYSIDPTLVYTKLREVKAELKKHGFIVSGDGHSVASDEPTHDGRGIEAIYIRR